MQRGCALVHGEHVGASAHVGARVTWLDIANSQDAVEIHGSGWQFSIVQAGPHQSISRRLQGGPGDGMGVKGGAQSPGKQVSPSSNPIDCSLPTHLALGCTDEGDVGSGAHTLAPLLLHSHCDGLAWSLCRGWVLGRRPPSQ